MPQPTVQDVDPGVDHTAKDADLPPELRRTAVFYRSDYPPGTIIVNTNDRFLYLIQGNMLPCATASASAATASSGAASIASPARRNGRIGRRRRR